jgi:Ca2+-binding RTX toxin-like protein
VVTISAGIETLNVSSTGSANEIGDLVFGGTTLNITGDNNFTVDAGLDEAVSTIDASAFTGKLDLTSVDDTTTPDALSGSVDVVDLTVTGGSGNDTLVLTANGADNEILVNSGDGDDTITIGAVMANASATLAGDIIDGGAGTDTLAGDVDLFDAGTAGYTGVTTVTGLSNVEKLSVSGFTNEANIINAANISADIDTVVITTAVNGTNAFTINAAADFTVEVIGSAILDGNTLTVDSGAGTSDALTVKNTNLATGTNQMGADDMNITATDFETVTIDSGSYTATTSQNAGAINVGTANDLILTGSNGFTTKATTGIITAKTIDASAGGALIMNVAAAAGVTTITGSANADTLSGDAASTISGGGGNDTITGGTGNDTLNGGAGNDGITTNTGNDTVDGGAGNDTFTFGANLTSADIIDGGDGTDTLSITDASLTAMNALGISDANTFNANFNNVETVKVTTAFDQTSFDAGYFSGATTFNLAAITGAESLVGLTSGSTVQLTTTLGDTLTMGVAGAATGAADALTIDFVGVTNDDYTIVAVQDVENLTIDVTEATASANIRAATVGLTMSKSVTTNPAQTLTIVGSESITIDTAIAAETVDASGMTVSLATDAGLAMSTAHTAAQTITGSGKVDTLFGSTKADTIDAGAGNDNITAGSGGDTVDGGAGTDTYITTAADTLANIDGTGTGTSTGIFINLGATAVTDATVLGTIAQNISGSLSSVGAGQAAYVFNGSVASNSAQMDTISNVENVTLADGINYVIGTATANTITGGSGTDWITPGNGADTVNGRGGADTITLTETAANAAADTLVRAGNATTDGKDTVVGFNVADDIIDFTTNAALVNGTAVTAYAEGTKANAAATTAVFVMSNNITVADATAGPSEAEIETYLGATLIFQNGATNDGLYVFADDGTNTYGMLVFEGAGGTDKQFDANDDVGTTFLILSGISDATTLSAANFADFT